MKKLIYPITIGGVNCASNLFLAPMAGVSDAPFRLLCLRGGAGLVCAEMVSANAIFYKNKKSLKMLEISPKEHPLSMQVFGSDEKIIAQACKKAQDCGADIVDINAGCPVKKINKAGAGCVLMKEPLKLAKIIESAVKSVSIPVTLKTRTALNAGENLAPLFAKIAQESGAAAVTLHARAASAMHSGPADLKALESAASAVKIPVIANGGAFDAASVKELLDTGARAVMIGRGALGNPFIFEDIKLELNGGRAPHARSGRDIAAIFLSLVEENAAFYGQRTGISRCKKTLGFWLKGFEGAASAREAFARAQTLEEARKILQPLSDNL